MYQFKLYSKCIEIEKVMLTHEKAKEIEDRLQFQWIEGSEEMGKEVISCVRKEIQSGFREKVTDVETSDWDDRTTKNPHVWTCAFVKGAKQGDEDYWKTFIREAKEELHPKHPLVQVAELSKEKLNLDLVMKSQPAYLRYFFVPTNFSIKEVQEFPYSSGGSNFDVISVALFLEHHVHLHFRERVENMLFTMLHEAKTKKERSEVF